MAGTDEAADLTVPKFSSFKSKEHVGSSENKDSHGPSVPKFASFKRKAEPSGRNEGETSRRCHRDDDRRRHHRSERDRESHHTKRRHHDSHDHRREKHSRRSRSPGGMTERRDKPLSRGVDEPKSDLFFFDKKADPLIIKYGGIERSKIPAYRRYGRGRVLGTSGRLVIHRDGPREQFSLRMPGEGSGMFADKDGLRVKRSRLRNHVPLNLRPRKVSLEDDDDDGFIAVDNPRALERDADSDDDEHQPDYRSIEGKAKAQIQAEQQSSDESSSEEEMVPLDKSNPLKWRSIQLSREVKEHPENIDAWIDLVNHQDALLRAGEDMDHSVVESEAHSYSEIKVSMLESALPHATSPRDRNRVLNYLMREGAKVWSSKATVKKWTEIHGDEENNFLLWKTHLDFCMSDISSFHYDRVRDMLFSRLRQATSRPAPDPRQNDFSEAIYVFLRATRFIHDAGYRELSVAAWQALLEINFFRPSGMDEPQDAMASFQDFWESEVPRLGESGAQGWRAFVEADTDVNPPDPAGGEPQPEPSGDPVRTWSALERFQGQAARLPARTMDEGTEDDPFRVVMFTDIEPLLFVIPLSVFPGILHQVLDAFLIFCGLPPHSPSDEWISTAWEDQFLTGARADIPVQGTWERADDGHEENGRGPPAFSPHGFHAACVVDILFPGSNWFSYLGCAVESKTVSLSWVQNVTSQLVLEASVRSLAPYHLSLSSLDSSCNIKKVAKALLKKHPTNTDLYNTYALAEHAQGNGDVAIKVLRSATDIEQGQSPGRSMALWRTWAWLELEGGNKNLATKRLCSSVDVFLRKTPDDDGTQISGSHILKARQVFESYGGESVQEDTLWTYGEALALLAYLTTEGGTEPTSTAQGNISAAMDSVDKACREMKFRGVEGTATHEGLLQFAARLLYFNATRGPFRRAYMREQLTRFMGIFPRNTIFQSLLEWTDSSLRVVDETRTLLHDKALVSPHDCVSSRLFAVQHELHRGNANTSTAALEQATASDACRSSVQMWIGYIRFCQAHREKQQRAKDVFYRALRHCPWSKEVMMEAFTTLMQKMGQEELRAVYETMSSKGMRIHVDLEEFVGKRGRGS